MRKIVQPVQASKEKMREINEGVARLDNYLGKLIEEDRSEERFSEFEDYAMEPGARIKTYARRARGA